MLCCDLMLQFYVLRQCHNILMLTFCDSFCSQYHGNLLGFENLYILDSSTDTRCISFLRYARDSLGVNVLFTDVNLNQLESITTKIGKDICGSSDLILKMDIEVVFTRGVSLSHSMNTCTFSHFISIRF